MNTITIPKGFAKGGFVIVPQVEYEKLCARPPVREFTPTKSDLRAIARGRRNYQLGKTISLDELERRLAHKSR